MAEIKSTLDLILEKTQNMVLTDEEKKEIRLKELTSKIRGWVRKFNDNALKLDAISAEIDKEGTDRLPDVRKLLLQEILQSIDLEADNTKSFQLLEDILGFDPNPIHDLIASFKSQAEQRKKESLHAMREMLKAQGIVGSAILPNLKHDEEWNTFNLRLKEDIRSEILLSANN